MLWVIFLWSLIAIYAAIPSLVVFGLAYQLCRFAISRGHLRHLWVIHMVALSIMAATSYTIIQKKDLQHPLLWPFFAACVLIFFVIYYRAVITLKKIPLGASSIDSTTAPLDVKREPPKPIGFRAWKQKWKLLFLIFPALLYWLLQLYLAHDFRQEIVGTWSTDPTVCSSTETNYSQDGVYTHIMISETNVGYESQLLSRKQYEIKPSIFGPVMYFDGVRANSNYEIDSSSGILKTSSWSGYAKWHRTKSCSLP
jgi:hypothetical protein